MEKEIQIKKESNELHIGSIPYEWNDGDLLNFIQIRGLSTYVTKATIKRTPNGQSKGYGFVSLTISETDPMFQIFIDNLNGVQAKDGLSLDVERTKHSRKQ